MQGKHARHQWRHPPRVVGTDDPRPLYTPTLQGMEGGEKVGDVLLVFSLDAQPHDAGASTIRRPVYFGRVALTSSLT